MTRSEQREEVLLLTFEKTFHRESVAEIIERYEEVNNKKTCDFVRREVAGVFDHLQKIDEVIERHCVGWRLERIPRVPLCILRIAVFEILFRADIPVGATINEAVELCKKYALPQDKNFVNGILGNVVKEAEKSADEKQQES